jgi:ring-1,2-phenylacetyl-CoA epoxidase subunit PaaD
MQAALAHPGPTRRDVRRDAVDAPAEARPGPARASLRPAWLSRCGAGAGRGHAAAPADTPFAAPAPTACTASTWASSWPRCSRCSGSFPGGGGERRPSTPTAPGRCCARCLTPRCPCCRCATWASCVRCAPAATCRPGCEVVLTPTYSGCPATEVIAQSVHDALAARRLCAGDRRHPSGAGLDHRLDQRRRPPQAARLRHRPAQRRGAPCTTAHAPIRMHARGVDCPRCGSARTERLSAFGSTACKALHRCLAAASPSNTSSPSDQAHLTQPI